MTDRARERERNGRETEMSFGNWGQKKTKGKKIWNMREFSLPFSHQMVISHAQKTGIQVSFKTSLYQDTPDSFTNHTKHINLTNLIGQAAFQKCTYLG